MYIENEKGVSFAKAKGHDETTKGFSVERRKKELCNKMSVSLRFFYRLLYMGLGFREKEIVYVLF